MDAEYRPQFAFPALIDSMLAAQGVTVTSVITAHGGETTEDALDRIDRDVLSANADIVIFGYGSNDYFIWGDPPASRVSSAHFRYNCSVLFEKLAGSGTHIIALAPPPVNGVRFYQYFDSTLYEGDGGVETLRSAYADILADIAAENENVELLRLDSAFIADAQLLGFDGVHPTPDGHRFIAIALLPRIMEALVDERRRPAQLRQLEVYPSPFMRGEVSVAVIRFPVDAPQEFTLRIVDSSGRQIRKIVYYAHTQGNHSIFWNGSRDDGTMVSSGAYTLSLQSVHQNFQTNRLIVF